MSIFNSFVYVFVYRADESLPFDIVSAYPNKLHEDDSITLQEAGLTPNAVAHLRTRKT